MNHKCFETLESWKGQPLHRSPREIKRASKIGNKVRRDYFEAVKDNSETRITAKAANIMTRMVQAPPVVIRGGQPIRPTSE